MLDRNIYLNFRHSAVLSHFRVIQSLSRSGQMFSNTNSVSTIQMTKQLFNMKPAKSPCVDYICKYRCSQILKQFKTSFVQTLALTIDFGCDWQLSISFGTHSVGNMRT